MTSAVSRAADPTLEELVASVGLDPERCAGSRAAALVERDGAHTTQVPGAFHRRPAGTVHNGRSKVTTRDRSSA